MDEQTAPFPDELPTQPIAYETLAQVASAWRAEIARQEAERAEESA